MPAVATALAVVVLVVVVVAAYFAHAGTPVLGFGLLVGGGSANLVDRLTASSHSVTDFVAVGSFPVFNLADAAVTVGLVCLIATALFGHQLVARR